MKVNLRGKHYASDKEVKMAMIQLLKKKKKKMTEFYVAEIIFTNPLRSGRI